MRPGWNVREHGDTRLNRFADRVDRIGDLLIPLILLVVCTCIGLLFLVVAFAGLIELVKWMLS